MRELVLVSGGFDPVHSGHVYLIQEASKYGDVIVLLNSDEWLRNKKGKETTYTIAGPICESSDILGKDIKLPEQNKDNFLIICDVGAYGAVMGVFLKQKLSNKPFTVVGNGKQTRDFVNVDDVSEAFKIAGFSKKITKFIMLALVNLNL